ncbi:MAG TPA: acetoin utilization protein AcuC, partial [Paracoccaceae bacterium]|nr:acetoin utilization protein AcuC [Paracoccaceae bacterium]
GGGGVPGGPPGGAGGVRGALVGGGGGPPPPATAMLETLADPPREGPVRAEVRERLAVLSARGMPG